MRKLKVLFICCLIFPSCDSNNNVSTHKLKLPVKREQLAEVNGDHLLDVKEKPKRNLKEKQVNHQKIVSKYGEQWDFCSCVQANDSINTVSQKGLNEKQAALLMKRWEVVEIKCKEFLTNPNRTPEERELHEKKVAKCLKSAKK
jgi:hypothetical protein